MAQSKIRGKIRDRFSWILFTLSGLQAAMPIFLLLSLAALAYEAAGYCQLKPNCTNFDQLVGP
jgi:hypothetical protein